MKIICIGRNYTDHAQELNNSIPKEPLFFLKPDTAIQPKGHPFFIPDFSSDIHYEVELVIKINRIGKHIEEKFAHKYYSLTYKNLNLIHSYYSCSKHYYNYYTE